MNPDRLTWIGRTDSGVVRQRLYDRDIGTLLLSPLDPGRKAWDAAIRKEGAHTGRFIDPHWYGLAGDGSALKFRQVCDAACLELQFPEMLMLDLEQVSMEYVRRLLNGAPGNRGLVGSNNPAYTDGTQAGRLIAYTNEPFKDGTVVPLTTIADAKIDFWPQVYYGDMSAADTAAVVLELVRWLETDLVGGAADRVHPFYDGKLIATDQRDGGYFTAERIPGVFSALSTAMGFTSMRERAKADITRDSLRSHYSGLAAGVAV